MASSGKHTMSAPRSRARPTQSTIKRPLPSRSPTTGLICARAILTYSILTPQSMSGPLGQRRHVAGDPVLGATAPRDGGPVSGQRTTCTRGSTVRHLASAARQSVPTSTNGPMERDVRPGGPGLRAARLRRLLPVPLVPQCLELRRGCKPGNGSDEFIEWIDGALEQNSAGTFGADPQLVTRGYAGGGEGGHGQGHLVFPGNSGRGWRTLYFVCHE